MSGQTLQSDFSEGDSVRDVLARPGYYDRIGKVINQHIVVEVEYQDGRRVLYRPERLEHVETALEKLIEQSEKAERVAT